MPKEPPWYTWTTSNWLLRQRKARLKAKLEEKFSLTTQGPCGPGGTEESVHFFKRKYEYDKMGSPSRWEQSTSRSWYSLWACRTRRPERRRNWLSQMGVPKSLLELEEATMQLQLASFCTLARTGQMHNIASVNWRVIWSDQQKASTDNWSTLRAT